MSVYDELSKQTALSVVSDNAVGMAGLDTAHLVPVTAEEISESMGIREIGSTGLDTTGGEIEEEFLPQLFGSKGREVFKEMGANDSIIGGILFSVDMLIRQVTWHMIPAEDEPTGEADAQFVEECRHDMSMSWEDTISEILSMLQYGWSYHEIVYKRRRGPRQNAEQRSQYNDGRIGWRKLPIRSQDSLDRWVFDEDGGLRGMIQQPAPTYEQIFVPIEKSLLFRTQIHKNNPEGKSILRNAYRSWVFKKRFEELEGIGVERDMAGIPIAFVDPKILKSDAKAEDKALLASIKKLVINLRRDQQEGVVFPRVYDEGGRLLYDIQLMNSGGSRQFDVGMIIDRYDRRMAQSVLADFIMLGHEAVGSFALSSSKTRLFAVALGAWLDLIQAVFNRVAIPRLFKINGIERNEYPKLKHDDLEIPNLQEIADYVTKLAGVGIIFDDDPTEDHLRAVAKLPDRPLNQEPREGEDDEEQREQPTAPRPDNRVRVRPAGSGGPPPQTIEGGDKGRTGPNRGL